VDTGYDYPFDSFLAKKNMNAALFASVVMRKHGWLVSFVQPELWFTFFEFQ